MVKPPHFDLFLSPPVFIHILYISNIMVLSLAHNKNKGLNLDIRKNVNVRYKII